MDERIQKIIDFTADKFKLEAFYLKRHSIFREKVDQNDESFVLNMEWFPNDAIISDEDLNPAGTVSIDIDIHTRLIRRVIFVEGENKLEADLPKSGNTELAIEWIEQETGLEFGRQFKLVHEDDKELFFQAAVDNIAVFPSGSIQMEFNDGHKLALFSIDGHFPNEEQLNWEPFALTSEKIEPIAKAQTKLLEIPLEDEEKWKAIYGITTVFVTNDGDKTISYEQVESPESYTHHDLVLQWDEAIEEPLTRKDIDLSQEVTVEEAFAKKQTQENKPLSSDEQKQAIKTVQNFMQREYPQASGDWKLAALWREKAYIIAELRTAKPDARVIDRKIKLLIDGANFEALNYVDNQSLVDMFKHFEHAEEPKFSEEEAFEKLAKHIEIAPVYVFDKAQNRYILCGKVDCGYGVDSFTGEVILLDEL
ncbi:hypothetical protein [Oceanobacillus polygoni]|uniref:Uncharacterized protein n=1 Tax=Oceanobacillus polygoni TaxID=1235259 RepID=A0A9X1CA92_9BACI|nr:hypothetical protein [Oceanobacillus polygoni]MBP2076344.1 hypothetical protein [Oceanobacillus polygoni]